MTTIIGYRDPLREIWIGGDTHGSRGSFTVPWRLHKLIRLGDWRLAWAGSASLAAAVEQHAGLLANATSILDFTARLREAMREAGFGDLRGSDGDNMGPPNYGQEFVVARPGELWHIEPQGAYAAADPLIIIGSGQDVAYGAAEALLRGAQVYSGRDLILEGLDIAAKYYASTSPPFWVERVE